MKQTENKERGFKRQMTLGDKIKCALWCIGVILFSIWMGSIVPLLVLPFVVDVYWMHFIPWSWWRDIENRFLREIMSWVDAIVFAVVAVWVLQNFFVQNFQIPTTSLEKTMLAGDYLVVSKFHYGPRVPMTPLSLPLFQHTISIGDVNLGKSYIEHPQLSYNRRPGLTEIKRGNIVVFNYPNGDSIIANTPEIDYYQVRDYYMNGLGMSRAQFEKTVGEITTRPVDRRENYVKRCVALPGDSIVIIDRQLYVNGEEFKNPQFMQQMRFVYTNSATATIPTSFWRNLGIYTKGNGTVNSDVREIVGNEFTYIIQHMGIQPDSVTGQYNHLYSVNLTDEKANLVAQRKDVAWVILEPAQFQAASGIFPGSPLFNWSQNSFGPLWIPSKGSTIELNDKNEALYGRCIRVYEGNTLVRQEDGKYLVNGERCDSYTFKMDYYWMMGDNRDNSLDSRFWGFVPENHIVGTPILVWMSVDPETGDFRWDRFLKAVKE